MANRSRNLHDLPPHALLLFLRLLRVRNPLERTCFGGLPSKRCTHEGPVVHGIEEVLPQQPQDRSCRLAGSDRGRVDLRLPRYGSRPARASASAALACGRRRAKTGGREGRSSLRNALCRKENRWSVGPPSGVVARSGICHSLASCLPCLASSPCLGERWRALDTSSTNRSYPHERQMPNPPPGRRNAFGGFPRWRCPGGGWSQPIPPPPRFRGWR